MEFKNKFIGTALITLLFFIIYLINHYTWQQDYILNLSVIYGYAFGLLMLYYEYKYIQELNEGDLKKIKIFKNNVDNLIT